MRGLFVTLEGGEGSGKTTVAYEVIKKLTQEGFDVVYTREPGGSPIAEKIRDLILNPEHTEMDSRTEALLYAAARRQHLIEKVQPALAAGKIVVCDRFIDSSIVYQGHAREIGVSDVYKINKFAIEKCLPDITIFFDIKPSLGLARIAANKNREINRLDLEEVVFHEKVYEGYLNQMIKEPLRIKAVNATQSIAAVSHAVYELIMKGLKETHRTSSKK